MAFNFRLLSFSPFSPHFSPYNLTSVLFEETETEKYSSVVAVINERDAGKIKSFEDFKGKRACFGEFGGIGKSTHSSSAYKIYYKKTFFQPQSPSSMSPKTAEFSSVPTANSASSSGHISAKAACPAARTFSTTLQPQILIHYVRFVKLN